MFTDVERELIELELAGTLQADKSALTGLIGKYHAVRVEADSTPLLYARNAIQYVERSAWVEDPALVIRLLQNYAIQAQFDAIIQRLRQLPPPRFHPGTSSWETCLLALSLPFLGREKTRTAVRDFFPPDVGRAPTAHVLVVDGGAQTGKTFTHDYVRYVASFPGQWSVAAVDFRTQVVAHLGPAELFHFLAEQIAPDRTITITPPTEEQRSRWVIDLTGSLVDLAAQTGKSWIIVLDGFRGPDVPTETHAFIQQLAAGLAGVPLAWNLEATETPPLRLVLLDYAEPLQVENGLVRRETAQTVDHAGVKDYFRRFARYKGWPEFADAALDQIASFTMQKVSARQPVTNREIAAAVLEVAAEMERNYGMEAPR